MSNFIKSSIKLLSLDKSYEEYIKNILSAVDNDMNEVLSKKTKQAGGRLDPTRLKGLTPTDYSKLIWVKLLGYSAAMDSIVLSNIQSKLSGLKELPERSVQILGEIEAKINNLSKIRDQILLLKPFYLNKLDYERKSMQKVNARHIVLKDLMDKGMDIESMKGLQQDIENYNQFITDLDKKSTLRKEEKYGEEGL